MALKRTIRWLIILVLAAFIAIRFGAIRSAILLGTYVTGGATGCSLPATLNVINPDLYEHKSALDLSSKVIESDGNLVHVRTPHGDFWSPTGTDVAFLLAEEELDLYRAGDPELGIRSGDIVLDCGANIGTFTRKALAAGASKVVAIEISPRNIESLNRTFEAEIADGRVVVVPEGVWHEDSTLQLSFYNNSALDSVVMRERVEESESAELVDVPLTTIDAIASRLGLERVDFIKMDVEGAERNALRGAADVLQRFRPRLAIAAENLPDDVDEIPRTIAEFVTDYEFETGECRRIAPFLIRPEVLHFY